MKKSIDILEEIIKLKGEEWKKYLDTWLKEEESDEENEETELFEAFIDAYKEDVYDNNKEILRLVEKRLDNDLLHNNLKEYIDKLIEAYNLIYPLRIVEIKNKEKVKELISIIFNEGIIRCNPRIEEKYKEYGLQSEEEFMDILGVLDSITTFVVANNLCRSAIEETILYNLRLSRELAKYISEIIDKYFEVLKTRIIIKKLY